MERRRVGSVEVIAEARRNYDIVIVDSPPILLVTDSAIVGTQVDGIMLVVRVGQEAQHVAPLRADAAEQPDLLPPRRDAGGDGAGHDEDGRQQRKPGDSRE